MQNIVVFFSFFFYLYQKNKMEIVLKKMKVENNQIVDYFLDDENAPIHLNEIIGRNVKIEFLNKIYCLKCGVKTIKSFSQGYCYKCFISIPETEDCVLKPELCQAHNGISRDLKYAEQHCLKPHYVYLALSNHVKVGVTRESQIPIRWIDQGASKAIKLAKTPNRNIAGLIEVALKQHLPDKTNWQKMLKNEIAHNIDLMEEKNRIKNLLSSEFKQYISDENEITEINYPSEKYPSKVKSFSFDNENIIEGILTGIKGQYLIFDNLNVVNIRKHGGYLVDIDFKK